MLPIKDFFEPWGKLNFKVEYEAEIYDATFDENYIYEKLPNTRILDWVRE